MSVLALVNNWSMRASIVRREGSAYSLQPVAILKTFCRPTSSQMATGLLSCEIHMAIASVMLAFFNFVNLTEVA